MPLLDLAAIKSAVTFSQLMNRYEWKRIRKQNATHFVGRCPIHQDATDDDSFKASLKDSGWVFKCFHPSCKGQGNMLDLVAVVERVTVFQAARLLNDWFSLGAFKDSGGTQGAKPLRKESVQELEKVNTSPPDRFTDEQVNKPLAFTLKDVSAEHPLIQDRGITVETARSFGVGFFPGKGSMAGRIVFPLMQQIGDTVALVGYAGRAVNGDPIKWKLPAGLLKNFLYGLERCDPHKPLIVVESPWAVLFLTQNGYQAAALMGDAMTEEQEKALSGFKYLTLALDNDKAGREATQKIAQRLRPNHHLTIMYLKE